MKLLVIRHAIAEDRDEWAKTGASDDLRPLTKKGLKRMRAAVRGLAKVVPGLDVVATSPYTRAVQTAELIGQTFGDKGVLVIDQLVPEQPVQAVLDWLRGLEEVKSAAVVGHEPHLTTLVSWLLTGKEQPLLDLKKGGAVMLEFNGTVDAGSAKLIWASTPKQLRQLA